MSPRRARADRSARRRAVALMAAVAAVAACSDSGSGAYERAAAAQQRARASSSPAPGAAATASPATGSEAATPSARPSVTVEATTVASPPSVVSPIPTDDDQVVGVFAISEVAVGPDAVGDLQVTAQVRNTGEDARGATLTAYVLFGGDRVGTATGTVTPLQPGETVAASFGGLTNFTDQFDQVVFQVDYEFGQP